MAAEESESASLGVVFAYSLPPLSNGFAGALLSLYLLKYATDVLLLAPAAIGLIFSVARIWDGVSDPLAGYLSDRTRSRLGRRRSWMLGSIVPLGMACIAMWSAPMSLGPSGLTLWLGAAILLYFTAQTAFNIPHKALGAELCLDHHGRTRIFAGNAVGEIVGSICAVVALTLVADSADLRATMSRVGWAVGLTSGVAIAWAVVALRERPEFQRRPMGSPFLAFRDVLRSPYARPLIFVYFLEFLGFNSLLALLPFASEYVLLTPDWTFLYAGVCLGMAVASAPFMVPMARRFGKKRLWLASMLTKSAVFTAMFFYCREGGGPVILGLTAFYGVAYACGLVIGPSVKADVIDFDEHQTGQRKEGTYFATWNMTQKTGVAAAVALSGFGLSLVGFEPNVDQTSSAVLGITVLFAGVPAVFHLFGAYVLWRLRYDDSEHACVRRELDLRRSLPAA